MKNLLVEKRWKATTNASGKLLDSITATRLDERSSEFILRNIEALQRKMTAEAAEPLTQHSSARAIVSKCVKYAENASKFIQLNLG